MSWLDFVIVFIFAAVVTLEVVRGFGRAIFDFAAVLLATRAASMLVSPLSGSIKLSSQPYVNEARVYILSFIVVGGVLFFVGKLIYDTTLISADTFDPPLGGLFGFGAAIALCHVIVRTMALSAGPGVIPPGIAASLLGTELLTFESYHRILDVLYHFNEE